MAKYTLKTLYGTRVLEVFEHRAPPKLKEILRHDKFLHAGEKGPFGDDVVHPDNFIILDSQRYKIFAGNITEILEFVKKLK